MDIRRGKLSDAAALCGIYNYYVEHTAVTFDTVPMKTEEMERRISETLDSGLPFYVAESNGEIEGYCYIHPWNTKSAYITTQEVTIYLRPDKKGHGVGTQLLRRLLDSIDRKTVHVLISGITLPNEASVRLHEKFGFRQVSDMKQVGWKLDRWRDVGHWELIL